jgi:hypothetical protein
MVRRHFESVEPQLDAEPAEHLRPFTPSPLPPKYTVPVDCAL